MFSPLSAVVGVPDEILGQAIKAYISFKDEYSLREKDIVRYCMESLEGFIIPKYTQCIKSLPKTPNGKIDKLSLKAMG